MAEVAQLLVAERLVDVLADLSRLIKPAAYSCSCSDLFIVGVALLALHTAALLGTKISVNIFIFRYRTVCIPSCYYFTCAMPQHLSTMLHWEVEGSRGRLDGWPGLYPGGGQDVSSTPGLLPCWLASRGR